MIYLLLSFFAFAKEQDLKMFNKGKYESVQIKKIENVRVANCKNKNCQALKALKKKPTPTPKKNVVSSNPSSAHCWDAGGKPRILKDKKNNEIDYCLFKDGSMVDGWDLYYAHHPQN